MSILQHDGKLHKKLLKTSSQFVFVGHHIKVFNVSIYYTLIYIRKIENNGLNKIMWI